MDLGYEDQAAARCSSMKHGWPPFPAESSGLTVQMPRNIM